MLSPFNVRDKGLVSLSWHFGEKFDCFVQIGLHNILCILRYYFRNFSIQFIYAINKIDLMNITSFSNEAISLGFVGSCDFSRHCTWFALWEYRTRNGLRWQIHLNNWEINGSINNRLISMHVLWLAISLKLNIWEYHHISLECRNLVEHNSVGKESDTMEKKNRGESERQKKKTVIASISGAYCDFVSNVKSHARINSRHAHSETISVHA